MPTRASSKSLNIPEALEQVRKKLEEPYQESKRKYEQYGGEDDGRLGQHAKRYAAVLPEPARALVDGLPEPQKKKPFELPPEYDEVFRIQQAEEDEEEDYDFCD